MIKTAIRPTVPLKRAKPPANAMLSPTPTNMRRLGEKRSETMPKGATRRQVERARIAMKPPIAWLPNPNARRCTGR